ncbi:putative tubulin polyglutamylase ttll9 [Perkinsus olseni]|uniref:Putative tubulin polyglutamylase ttll9 n=1 Tax=Perkinsus olseni TaxID=32597 RepID=A0A7J6P778_PEROL|nr:putative tubulin polyglutamylase ttll9 [Perkinsus olseni]
MDGVTCDFELALMKEFKRRHPDEPCISVEQRKGFYCSKQYEALKPELGNYVKEIITSEGFISNLPPISGAIQSLRWLDEMPGVEVWICSTPLTAWTHCVPEKFEWVEKHLGSRMAEGGVLKWFQRSNELVNAVWAGFVVFLKLNRFRGRVVSTDFLRKLILTKDKTIIKADALIDDKPEITGSEDPPLFGRHVVFTQPYNKYVETGDRLDGWFKSRDEAELFVSRLRARERGKESNNPTTSVELNPWKCIANKTRKGARECTELYLCEEAAEDISSEIDKFPNVEVMWIEGNRLSSLLRLRTHSRLQEIYASNNYLTSLQGIEGCKFLRKLIVSSNRLEDLSKQLHLLSNLELDDNPCAREEKYRLRCIASLSSLAVLDCSPITLRERDLREQQQQQPPVSKRRVSLSEIIKPSISETEAFAEADKIRVRWARREEAAAVAGRQRLPRFWRKRFPTPARMNNSWRLSPRFVGEGCLTEELGRELAVSSTEAANIFPASTTPSATLISKLVEDCPWKFIEDERLQGMIDLLYREAKRMMAIGDAEGAQKKCLKALRFEGCKSRAADARMAAHPPVPPRTTLERRTAEARARTRGRLDTFTHTFIRDRVVLRQTASMS